MSTDRSDAHDVTVYPSGSGDTGESALQPGSTVAEFRIEKLIGEGGFGIVYLAHDESLDRTIALKEYMPSQLAERASGTSSVRVRSKRYADTFDAGMRSFINEAKLLARFDHPSLLKVYRFFQANGTAYMAMPFYEGQTLKSTLRGLSGPPDEKWLRQLLYQVLDGLEVIHAYDCYHRDIAPDNIMLQNDTPILLDFGAARRVIGDITRQLTVILKPGYAPIEQYAEDPNMKQGAWTDIYALASVVHFAMTRQAPPAAIGRAMSDGMVPLSQRMRGVYSDGLLKTIDAALSVKPEDRPQSVAELRAMLLASDERGSAAQATTTPVLAIESLQPAGAPSGRDPGTQPPKSIPAAPIVSAATEPMAAPAKARRQVAPGGSAWRSAIVPMALAVPAAAGALWWLMSRMDEPPRMEAQAPVTLKAEGVPPPAAQPAPVAPARVEQAAPAPVAAPQPPVAITPPVAVQPPPPVAAAPKPPATTPLRADAAKAKAPEPPPPTKAAAAPALRPEPVAPTARVEPRPAPREETVEAPPPAKAPPQQVARVEPKPEPAPPPPKAEAPKPPVEVARVEPKAAAPQPSALIGRYTGRLMSKDTPVGVTLVIQGVQDGAVSGTASQSVGPCSGDYRMTGTISEGSLRMRSTHAGGLYGDCSFGFRASVQGTKLVGQTTSGTPLELSR